MNLPPKNAVFLLSNFATTIVSAQEKNQNTGVILTSDRSFSLILTGVAIISLIIAVRSKKQIAALNKKRNLFTATALGIMAIVFSIIHIVSTTGFGTGGGKAGAILSLVIGVIGVSIALKTMFKN